MEREHPQDRDCRWIRQRLIRFESNHLELNESQAVEHHLAHCVPCLDELAAILNPDSPEMIADVMDSTNSDPCDRARMLMGPASDHGDQTVTSMQAEHLSGCVPCQEVNRAIHRLRLELPQMIEFADAELIERILDLTSRARGRWLRRWNAFINGIVKRPRFAMEFAFAIALLTLPFHPTLQNKMTAIPPFGSHWVGELNRVTVRAGQNIDQTSDGLWQTGIKAFGRLDNEWQRSKRWAADASTKIRIRSAHWVKHPSEVHKKEQE